MHQLVVRLEEMFDAVVIDAPPLLPVTDAAVLAQSVGSVVLVVGAQSVRNADVQRAIRSLEMVQADMLGVVLNKLPQKGPDAYAYSQYSYASSLPQRASDRGTDASLVPRVREAAVYPGRKNTSL